MSTPSSDIKAKSSWLPWALFTLVTAIGFIAWAEMRQWQFGNLTTYALFPLLGLWAWSIMWTHYAFGGIRLVSTLPKNVSYSRISGAIVLACLLLHPGLLAYGQWRTQDLLPPGSFYSYVGTSLKSAVLLGSISLLIFLAFDVGTRLKKYVWVRRNWRWLSLAQALAMTFIFIHSLRLGQNLQHGWFQFWWVVLGALLIPCFGLILREDFRRKEN